LRIELRRQRTGKRIGAATGRERHDEGDRLVRPRLGLARSDRDGCDKGEQSAPDDTWFHGIFLRLMDGRLSAARLFLPSRFQLQRGVGGVTASHRRQDAKRDPLK
jgi:hypothetical protein